MAIGYIIGSADTQGATVFLVDEARVGQYVVLESKEEPVIGLITSVVSDSPIFDDRMADSDMVKEMGEKKIQIPSFMKAKVKLICKLNSMTQPDLPPLAGTPVRLATNEELERIFANDGDIEVGSLIGKDVRVRIRGNALMRHLAILASTGSGKSNTVAVLSSRIAEKNGSVLVFDYHGEYYDSDIKKLNNVEAKMNPLYLTPSEFAMLLDIRDNAVIQYRVLRKAFKEFISDVERGMREGGTADLGKLDETFFSKLTEKVEEVAKKENRKKSVDEVLNKIEDFVDRFSDIISFTVGDVTQRVRRGMVNVVNLSSLDEEGIDAIVSHYLRRVLTARKEYKTRKKEGLKHPIVLVIEEAHVLLSKDENTLTKRWAGRIAREGRKFGVGLVVVSQRPKGIDENILSQMINKIILKMVEPTDKRYVLEASDNLSEDIIDSLSSFAPGEALIVGNIVRVPAVVKIDKFEGKLGGSEPSLFEEEEKDDYSDVLNWGI